MPSFLRSIAAFAVASSLAIAVPALAAQAGWSQITVPGLPNAQEPIAVALYYPSQATERSIAMGPFLAHVAPRAKPDPMVKGLILVSHGQGGSELTHESLAEALARHGYLVAALRHPGVCAYPTEDGDLRDDPPGFDRSTFLRRLQREVPDFFDTALSPSSMAR